MIYLTGVIIERKGYCSVLNKFRFYICLPTIAALLTACSSTTSSSVKDDDSGALETYNHAVYNFNMKFNRYVMKPVAKGYRNITNQYVRERVNNALSNIKEPVFALNHLLQGELANSGKDLARFAINTTLGIAGTYDVAGLGWNLPKNKTGFDNTLAAWGVPDGPFLMLPFVGPSTPRATVGLVADSFANPVYIATRADANTRDKIYYTYIAVNGIALYENNMDLLDDLERNSVDFYTTMKSAYLQNRTGNDAASDTSASYDFGMDDEEDDEEDY